MGGAHLAVLLPVTTMVATLVNKGAEKLVRLSTTHVIVVVLHARVIMMAAMVTPVVVMHSVLVRRSGSDEHQH